MVSNLLHKTILVFHSPPNVFSGRSVDGDYAAVGHHADYTNAIVSFRNLNPLELCQFLQHRPHNLLQLAKVMQVRLKLPIQFQRAIRRELSPDDHVAHVHRVRQYRILIQLLKRGFRIIVVHTLMMRALPVAGQGVLIPPAGRQRIILSER
jgi:hypothetical protein